jgi:hypothetical protein
LIDDELRDAHTARGPRVRLELGLQESVKSAVGRGHGVDLHLADGG